MLFIRSLLLLSISAWMLIYSPKTGAAEMFPIKSKNLIYKESETNLEGFLAEPVRAKGLRPAVIIVHNWLGLSEDNKNEANEFAKKGFVALAADIFGQGGRPKTPEEAGKNAGLYKSNRPLLRARIKAAYDQLISKSNVDPHKVVILGYCFGGMTALELGRAGVPLAGIASFHGNLDNPTPADAKNIQGKVLIMHGALDPYVNAEQVSLFEKEMNEAGKDYQLIKYSGAVHSFTDKSAGSDIKTGAAYNAVADKRSKLLFQSFLEEILH